MSTFDDFMISEAVDLRGKLAKAHQLIEELKIKLHRADKEIEALNIETCDVKCPNCGYFPIFAAYARMPNTE